MIPARDLLERCVLRIFEAFKQIPGATTLMEEGADLSVASTSTDDDLRGKNPLVSRRGSGAGVGVGDSHQAGSSSEAQVACCTPIQLGLSPMTLRRSIVTQPLGHRSFCGGSCAPSSDDRQGEGSP